MEPSIGEFEEIVLLVTRSFKESAHSATIAVVIKNETGRNVGRNMVHLTLQRLEIKGLVTSKIAGATKERGGRSKRFFTITRQGAKILALQKEVRDRLWQKVVVKS